MAPDPTDPPEPTTTAASVGASTDPTERDRALHAAVLGAILGTALAVLSRRARTRGRR